MDDERPNNEEKDDKRKTETVKGNGQCKKEKDQWGQTDRERQNLNSGSIVDCTKTLMRMLSM